MSHGNSALARTNVRELLDEGVSCCGTSPVEETEQPMPNLRPVNARLYDWREPDGYG